MAEDDKRKPDERIHEDKKGSEFSKDSGELVPLKRPPHPDTIIVESTDTIRVTIGHDSTEKKNL